MKPQQWLGTEHKMQNLLNNSLQQGWENSGPRQWPAEAFSKYVQI